MQVDELCNLLDEKYKVRSQQNLDLILDRIKDGLHAHAIVEDIDDITVVQDTQPGKIEI